MKTTCSIFICALTVQLLSTGICSAQTTLALNAAPAGVTVDGSGKEWGDKMAYNDAQTKVDYTLSNDKTNLYLVIKTKDPIQQASILGAGVTFSIDTKGRKKSSYTLTFPVAPADRDRTSFLTMGGDQIQTDAGYETAHGKIHADGYKDISDDPLTGDNSYGIKIAIGYDETGYLVYEEAIPLTLFHAGDLLTKEWAYNIKLNPLQGKAKPAQNILTTGGYKKGGGGKKGSRDAPDPAPAAEPSTTLTDVTPELSFWGKFTLAK